MTKISGLFNVALLTAVSIHASAQLHPQADFTANTIHTQCQPATNIPVVLPTYLNELNAALIQAGLSYPENTDSDLLSQQGLFILNNFDQDLDGIGNDLESQLGSDPNNRDSDGDGLNDTWEYVYGTDITGDDGYGLLDVDGDGLPTIDEITNSWDRLDPHNPDCDGDGLRDSYEVAFYLSPAGPGNEYNQTVYSPVATDKTHGQRQGTNYSGLDYDNDGILDRDDTLCPFDYLNDIDNDGICDNSVVTSLSIPTDNCPGWPNADQLDTDNDGVGDACQCGDINSDGSINASDLAMISSSANQLDTSTLTLQQLQNCDVSGDSFCTATDLNLLSNHINNPGENPITSACASHVTTYEKVLSRIGYGPSNIDKSEQLRNIANEGLGNYIFAQLQAVTDPASEDSVFNTLLSNYKTTASAFPVLDHGYTYLRNHYGCSNQCGPNKDQSQLDWHQRIPNTLAEVKLLKAVHSNKQLQAVLSDFWFNHFNVFAGFGAEIWLSPQYIRDIEGTMNTSFEHLLTAVALSPAMMEYLNLTHSSAGTPNQNFARELLELHTIGPDDTYDEDQIAEVSRILTGFRVGYSRPYTADGFPQYYFDSASHDQGVKTVVLAAENGGTTTWRFGDPDENNNTQCHSNIHGQITANLGEDEFRVLICLLAQHPKTAEMIGKKMILRFLGDDAYEETGLTSTPEHLESFKLVWQITKGNLVSSLASLLLGRPAGSSPDQGTYLERSVFLDTNKTKRPFVDAASMLRALGLSLDGESTYATSTDYSNSYYGLMGYTTRHGEYLYRVAPPTGLPDVGAAWQGNNYILNHIETIDELVNYFSASSPTNNISFINLPEYSMYLRIKDGNEVLTPKTRLHEYTANNALLVDLLAERLLPGNSLDVDIRANIIQHLDDIGGSFTYRKMEASKLIFSQPRAMHH